jgi:ABC-type polysaccharide/polyol phosphate export permease
MTRVTEYLKTSFQDVYRFRDVLTNILSQDLKVKYKRTAFGYFWSLLNPILQLLILSAVFSHIVRLGMKDYTLFLFSGMLAWTFFSTAIQMSAHALLENENFIKKVYLPKLLFPLSKVCLRLIDFLFSLAALSLIGIVVGFSFKLTLALVPFAILILAIFSLGLGMALAVANVYFRDVQYLLTVFIQLAYFATPIMYPLSVVPPHVQRFILLNPIYPQIHLFQKLIYAGVVPGAEEWAVAVAGSVVAFFIGIATLATFDEDLVFRM